MAKIINLRNHVKPKKKLEPVDASKLKALLAGTLVRKKPNRKPKSKRGKSKPVGPRRLRLFGRWRSEVFEKQKCFECGALVSHSFLYRKTNVENAKVYLCVMCEAIVIERSFGRTDAMERAILVGQVESNRRRH